MSETFEPAIQALFDRNALLVRQRRRRQGLLGRTKQAAGKLWLKYMFWSVRRRHSRLGDQLQDLVSMSMQRLPGKVRDALVRDAELVAEAGGHALREGDTAPDFVLPDSKGQIVRLSSILEQGPVVLSFYRGGWCPYCNLEIRALQDVLPQIRSLGAVLVAVSPEPPDKPMSMSHMARLDFDVLSDLGNRVHMRSNSSAHLVMICAQ